MSGGPDSVQDLELINAPWGKEITIGEATYEGGFKMLRIRIKEGKSRFTDLELDFVTAAKLGGAVADWAKANTPSQ